MKKLTIVLLALLLPMISLAQSAVSRTESAQECNKKGDEYYNKKEYKQAVEWYQKAANQGYATAQYNLGAMYESGRGVSKDYDKACKWYKKAANQGDADAQNNLGYMYYNGYGVTKDYAKAVEWWQKAANKGHAIAQCSLGWMYQIGYGVTRDYSIAVKWYQKAANQGNTNAQYDLGYMYENGYGVTKDYKKAIEWYQKAADQGDENAKHNLASLQKKMAEEKNALAQSAVTQTESAEECYKKGKEYYDKKDYKQAIEWYQKAANQGNVQAQFYLGLIYNNGFGVTQDFAKAVEWWQKAADQGHVTAQVCLGDKYKNGHGVTRDYSIAVKWYQKAANKGNTNALFDLGYMYENGYGVTIDYAKALDLYQKAANKGHGNAKEQIVSLQKKMAEEKNTLAQTTSTPKPAEKPKEQPKVQPQPQPKVGIDLVDTDIPVISRVNENTFALIFANENYTRETKVDYARNDGEVFRDYCRKTLGLPEKNVRFIPDATLNDLIGELDWLQQVCEAYGGDASVIFYYAGHGIPDESSGSAYLLPTDGNSRILRTCFSIDELYKMLGSMPAKKVTVLMDACFSGAKRSGGMLASARGVAIKAKTASPKGSMIVLSAAQGDETAYKYEDAKHGLFTYFLLKKLKDSKGNVTMGELSNYIQTQVKRYSIVENGKSQTPTIQTSDNLRSSWKSLTFY